MEITHLSHCQEPRWSRLSRAVFLSAVVVCSGYASEAVAASQTWDGSVSSAWNAGGNWVGNQFPGGDINTLDVSDLATFTTAALAPGGSTVVNTSYNPTLLGGISIGGSTSFSFTGSDFYLTNSGPVVTSSSSANQSFAQMLRSYHEDGLNQDMSLVNQGTGTVSFGALMKDVRLAAAPYTSTDGGDIVFEGDGDFVVGTLEKRRQGMTTDLMKKGGGTLTITGHVASFGDDPLSEEQSGLTGTTIIQGGTVRATSGDQRSLGQPQVPRAGWITLDGGALRVSSSDLSIDHPYAGVSITGTGGAFHIDAGRTLTIGGGGADNILSGDADFSITGGGTLVFNGDHPYEGGITVVEGKLMVNGSLAPFQINSSAGTALGGTGSITCTVIVAGTLAPGNGGVGTLSTVGDVQLSGAFHCDIDGAQADLLAVVGNLSIENLALVVDEIQTPANMSYVIATYTGDLFGAGFASVPQGYTIDVVSEPGKVILVRQDPPASAFDDWVEHFGLSGDELLATSDPDNDGVSNFMEFVLDGDPSVQDPSCLPQQSVADGNLVFTFYRRDDSESYASVVLQQGVDLASWTDITIGEESGSSGLVNWTVAENSVEPDFITVNIPVGTFSSQFARLRVAVNP